MGARQSLGSFGEDVAANHLARSGHRIVARRWRCARGEIDLIAQEGETLVFVEVRTRRAAEAGLAEESVGPAKRARLARLAYTYLADRPAEEWRIDVVAVSVDESGRVAQVTHIRHAVEDV